MSCCRNAGQRKASAGIIAGAIMAVVVALAFLAGALYLLWRGRRSRAMLAVDPFLDSAGSDAKVIINGMSQIAPASGALKIQMLSEQNFPPTGARVPAPPIIRIAPPIDTRHRETETASPDSIDNVALRALQERLRRVESHVGRASATDPPGIESVDRTRAAPNMFRTVSNTYEVHRLLSDAHAHVDRNY